jgi:hypothetical protein
MIHERRQAMKNVYLNNPLFSRRGLYFHKEISKQLDIEAAQERTDASQILNKALALYFAQKETKKEN